MGGSRCRRVQASPPAPHRQLAGLQSKVMGVLSSGVVVFAAFSDG